MIGDIAPAVSADGRVERCPFHQASPENFDHWLEEGLRCSAGKREFKLGRYHVARFRNGGEYADALDAFRQGVVEHRKTGFLGIFVHDETLYDNAADEVRLLGEAMQDAGLAADGGKLVAGETLSIPIEVACPVTGEDTTYEFFAVAFCRHSGDPKDPLYDPSLSAPFTAVNTTSDAFAFAMLVRDQSMRAFGKPPHEVEDREALEHLFRKCVTVWQNMSINTIQGYAAITEDPARGVHLTADRAHWIAAHNDPVFAEMKKCPHLHEMPVTYAERLTSKWLANLFDGKESRPTRDGQSGGVPMFTVEGIPSELYEF